MVLQQAVPLTVWGQSPPFETIQVSLADAEVSACADSAGDWEAVLPPQVAGGPHRLCVRSASGSLDLEDVWIGEVWLLAGQSNMEWTASQFPDATADAADAHAPMVRHFTLATHRAPLASNDIRGTWRVMSPESAPAFSAFGMYFAKFWGDRQSVALGLVVSALGDTSAEMWLSRSAMVADPVLRPAVEEFDGQLAVHTKGLATTAETAPDILMPSRGNSGARGKDDPNPRGGDASPRRPSREVGRLGEPSLPVIVSAACAAPQDVCTLEFLRRYAPCCLFNGMIHPLARCRFRGVIWYQGESNGRRASTYHRLLTRLISEWRTLFKSPELPVIVIQLPRFREVEVVAQVSMWADLREAQARAVSEMPLTWLVSCIDLGDPIDIHPPNKKEYARRALACVNANVYQQRVPWRGPSPRDWKIADGTVRVAFDGHGLDLRQNPHGSGFTLAGADGVFFAAHARLEETTVLVEAVKQPATLRYAWADNPPVTLFDQEGWPAAPFCINLRNSNQQQTCV